MGIHINTAYNEKRGSKFTRSVQAEVPASGHPSRCERIAHASDAARNAGVRPGRERLGRADLIKQLTASSAHYF